MDNKLKTTREQNLLSQSALAQKSGVGLRIIQNYEQGSRNISGARLATLLKLCLALNCRLSDILDDPETIALLEKYEH